MTDDEIDQRLRKLDDKIATRYAVLFLFFLFVMVLTALHLHRLEVRIEMLEQPQSTEVRK